MILVVGLTTSFTGPTNCKYYFATHMSIMSWCTTLLKLYPNHVNLWHFSHEFHFNVLLIYFHLVSFWINLDVHLEIRQQFSSLGFMFSEITIYLFSDRIQQAVFWKIRFLYLHYLALLVLHHQIIFTLKQSRSPFWSWSLGNWNTCKRWNKLFDIGKHFLKCSFNFISIGLAKIAKLAWDSFSLSVSMKYHKINLLNVAVVSTITSKVKLIKIFCKDGEVGFTCFRIHWKKSLYIYEELNIPFLKFISIFWSRVSLASLLW